MQHHRDVLNSHSMYHGTGFTPANFSGGLAIVCAVDCRLEVTAVSHALQVRLQWAQGAWQVPLKSAVLHLGRHASLTYLGVLRGDDRPPDLFLAATLEGVVRCTIGLSARAFALWMGGVYRLVLLTSPVDSVRRAASLDAAKCFRNVLFMEEILGRMDHEALQTVSAAFFWKDSAVYREIHSLILERRHGAAERYAWKLHSALLHEKGWARATCLATLFVSQVWACKMSGLTAFESRGLAVFPSHVCHVLVQEQALSAGSPSCHLPVVLRSSPPDLSRTLQASQSKADSNEK
jgi:hypothetical protein